MFVDKKEINDPRERRIDRELEKKLHKEENKEAFLAYLVEGAHEYIRLLENGESLLSIAPDLVKYNKDEWIKETLSPFENFVSDCLDITNHEKNEMTTTETVSYTHLTLPTNREV